MSLSSSVRICTRKELCGQKGLHPLLEMFIDSPVAGFTNELDRLIYLDLAEGAFFLVHASLDSDGVAHLLPGLSSYRSRREHRIALCEASIQWAKSQDALAIHIYVPADAEDDGIFAELGYPITTRILVLGRESCGGSDPGDLPDSSIRQTMIDNELSALSELTGKTLAHSLDIPESIPLRRPESLLRSWVESHSQEEVVTLVAESAGEMVGIVVATLQQYADEETGYHIHYLGVAENHRRQGWATRLLYQLFRLACEQSVEKFAVHVDQRNLPARQLYERLGFREFEDLRYSIVFQRLDQGT